LEGSGEESLSQSLEATVRTFAIHESFSWEAARWIPCRQRPWGGRRCTPKAIINVSRGFLRALEESLSGASQVQSHNKLGKPAPSRMEPWDVTIVGGGVLGTSIAYWLAQRYEGRIAVLEKEVDVAAHTSRRNTGVVHRPFYLDPVSRKVFARCAQVAYGMWKVYAASRGLPWLEISTFEVALREEDYGRLEKY